MTSFWLPICSPLRKIHIIFHMWNANSTCEIGNSHVKSNFMWNTCENFTIWLDDLNTIKGSDRCKSHFIGHYTDQFPTLRSSAIPPARNQISPYLALVTKSRLTPPPLVLTVKGPSRGLGMTFSRRNCKAEAVVYFDIGKDGHFDYYRNFPRSYEFQVCLHVVNSGFDFRPADCVI